MPHNVMKFKEVDSSNPCADCQYDLNKEREKDKKIKPKQVFDFKNTDSKKQKNKKVPKGSHRMPDGSIMKDSDMPSKGKSKKNKSGY